jgi:signal transduction histidine kinase
MRNIQVVRQYRSSRRVLARPGELRQAFANLIANAIDAMPRGGQLILRIRESNPRSLTITIADRGEGIPPAALCRIGEPLFTTKGEAGTGLGLWVTYQLIAKYGGAVRVYSSTRSTTNGTVFRICFTDATTLYANPTPDTSTPLHPQSNPLPSPQPSNPPLPSPIQKRA